MRGLDFASLAIAQREWLLLLILPAGFLLRSLWTHYRRSAPATDGVGISGDVLRFCSLSLLILALADLSIVVNSPDRRLIVLVDESDSIGEIGRQQVNEVLKSLSNELSSNNIELTQLSFAADSRTNPQPEPHRDSGEGASVTAWRADTNIADALRTAILNSDGAEQTGILLITDGRETKGRAIDVASWSPLPISTVPIQSGAENELMLQDVLIPATVSAGEPIQIQAIVEATNVCTVSVRCLVDGREVSEATQQLIKGSNTISFTHRFMADADLTLQLEPELSTGEAQPADTFKQNNVQTRRVRTAAPLRVLIVDTAPSDGEDFAGLLESQGIECDRSEPTGLPVTKTDLNHYGVVILSGVPATDLTAAQQMALQTWVESSGGGLLMTGGDRSFGPGGYYQTAVEEVLPVRCDFIEEEEKPTVGLLLIIDKSGSMSGPKMELARDAAKAAVELLSPTDSLGIIAFDGSPVWIRKPAPLTDREATLEEIGRILPGGGTALFPALVEAQPAMASINTRLRHILILTDGYSTEGNFEQIASELNESGVTISAAGLGDADRTLVELLARVGRGRHYFTQDPQSVPQIFARETMLAGNSSLREESFVPTTIRRSPSLFGIPFSECPPLHGYVRTRTKPNSEVLLTTPNGDPLLSWWRAGSGWGAAFASDIHPRWSREWLEWNSAGRFWAQVLRHIRRTEPSGASESDGMPATEDKEEDDDVESNEQFVSEYSGGTTNTDLLYQIASLSGGEYLTEAADLTSLPLASASFAEQRLLNYLLPAAMLLILVEAVVRNRERKERSLQHPFG